MNLLTNTLHRRWACLLVAIILMSGLQMFAQSGGGNSLSGKVVDKYDQPIIGAVVKVAGTSIGRSTDVDGAFTMKNVPSDATLEVTSIG